MKLLSALRTMLLPLVVVSISMPAAADTVGPLTTHFSNLATGADSLQRAYTTFAFPRFDSSLGSLQSIDLAFNFSGSVVGSATGVNRSSSINGTISHHVFFLLEDISGSVFLAEPTLRLDATIPAGAQNGTIVFGPELRSTSVSFSVAAGDRRFDALGSGSGDISGRLGVFFSNTTFGFNDQLLFFQGIDSGTYSGSFSVAYQFVPVPEPQILSLCAVAVLVFALRVCRQEALCRWRRPGEFRNGDGRVEIKT